MPASPFRSGGCRDQLRRRGFAGEFTIDVANGRATAVHQDNTHEQTCAFTAGAGIGRTDAAELGRFPRRCPAEEQPKVALPRGPALLRVIAGRGYASATVRIARRSKIRCQLMRRGTRVVGAARVMRRAGTHVVRVKLKPRIRKWMRARGLERVMLTVESSSDKNEARVRVQSPGAGVAGA